MFLPLVTAAQDSVKVSVPSVQARDLETMMSLCSFEQDEEWFDSVKVKFRVQTPPTGNTAVAVGQLYIVDWVRAFSRMHKNPGAILGGAYGRVGAALKAVNNPYLTAKIDGYLSADTVEVTNQRLNGRYRGRGIRGQ
jgi:hypothetical protein